MSQSLPPIVLQRVPELVNCCGSLCDRNKLVQQVEKGLTGGALLLHSAKVGETIFPAGTPWLEIIIAAVKEHEKHVRETTTRRIDNE